jgi:nitrite reductase/ring-hydroxylating ferredoxin subunit
MWADAAKTDELAPGGLKYARVNGVELTLGNYDGTIYAVGRRCGHMNALLDDGSLDGSILTCPLHNAQFDITTGKAISYPMPHHHSDETQSPAMAHEARVNHRLEWKIRLLDLATYPARVLGDTIQVDV